MINRDFFVELKRDHDAYGAGRREVIKIAGDALNASKRSIFAMHRDDLTEADRLLAAAAQGLGRIAELVVEQPDLAQEGSYRAALEENAEARLYRRFVADGSVGPVDEPAFDYEIYLSGLSDLTGELQRRQVRLATDGQIDAVRQLKDVIEAVVTEMLAIDLGGYLRTKFDQAKNNLRRAEEVLYDLSMRERR